jgi:hypothetical protein
VNRRPGTAVTLSIVAFVGLVACLLTGLVYTGKDTTPLVTFVFAIVPSTIGVILLGSKVDTLTTQNDEHSETLQKVEKAVNGNLERQFQAVHEHIVYATGVNAPGVATPEAANVPLPTDTTSPENGT